MKRFSYALIFFLILFSFQPSISAANSAKGGSDSVYDAIQNQNGGEKEKSATEKADSGGSSLSLFSSFVKFIFSFVLVIGLLFVLLRFLSKRNGLMQSRGPVIHLGGQQLGNNRSLQLLLIGQTIYVIGVGDDITLLRTISQGEEYQHLLESVENQAELEPPKWLPKDPKDLWDRTFTKYLKKMKQENGGE